jgi:gliding motility-associated-like protein
LIVTDTFGCFKNDFVTITVTPSSLTAEAGVGGALCLGTGDSVQLGGFPTAVGGTPPYTYTWSPLTGLNLTNPANPAAFPTASTKYFVTVTDALGCQSLDSTTVNVYPTLIANAGADTTVCAGSPFRLGADTTARGGSGSGYTYVWSPTVGVSNINAANPTAVATTTTTYAVTVTDGNGCTATDNVLVTVRPTPTAQAGPDKTLTRCAGDSVIIGDIPAAIGGTPGYTYAWSPATGLSSTTVANPVVRVGATTTYTLTVTDVNGCTSTDAVTVNVVNSTLSVNAGTDKEICFGNCVQLGSIPTAVGGFPPYYFTWSNGNTLDDSTDANPVACPTATTAYRLRATDSRGCVAIDDITVTVNPNPTANAGPDTSVCSGSSIQIGGAPTATGGTPGYTYSWNPSLGLSQPNVANPTAAPAVITTYQLIVTDTKGCIGLDEVTVTPRTTPVVDAGADKTLVSCAADTVIIGGLPAVTGGGTGPFTYLWTPATGLSSATVQNPSVTGITATTSYQLIVTDTFGCSGNDFVVVNVVNSTLQVEAGNGGVVCAASGSPVQLGGTPTAVGGTSPYVYTWSPATGLNAANVANPIATVISTTKYYLTVTDAKGCQAIDSVTVQQNATPVANAGADTALCAGFCTTLNGSATGGSGNYQYAWSPTVGLSNNNTPNPLACPQVTTTYILTVTDSLGCNSADAVTITILAKPVADAGTDKNLTACFGDSVQIGGSPAASGGIGPYTYAWSPATGLSSTSIANPVVKGITSTTLYSLTVTDASGCSAVDVVQVNIVPSALVANAGPDIFTCFNNSGATLTIGGSPTATGGTGPYTYSWSGPNINAPNNAANITVSPITAGVYNVTVTDAKGCTATDFAIVNASTPVSVNVGPDTSICAGTSVSLGAMATGATSYQWSPGTGLSSTTIPNPVATPTATTTYSVTITYGNNCTASDAITITVRPRPSANAGPDRTMTACSADSVQLGGTPAATGGTAPYTYSWTPTAGLTDSLAARPWVKNLGATALYTLNVTDASGCTGTDQVQVTVIGGTLSAEAGNNVSFCFGTATNVTLGGTPTVVGGTAPYTYTWSPAAGLSATNVANPVANTSISRTYTVVVRDANGCEAQDTVRITVNPRIVANAGAIDTVCAGSCITLGGTPTALGGSGSTYTYVWGPAIYFQGSNIVANPVVCPLNSVTYTVVATDSIGCTNSANVTILVNQNPVANAGIDRTVVSCANACVALGGSPTATGGTSPYLYAWSPSTALNNTGLPNPTVCGLGSTGNYTVTVTDANGCTSSDQVLINTTQSTLVADAGIDKTICAGQNTCITIGGTPAVSGGVGPYSITWYPVGGMCTSNTIANPQVLPTDTTMYVLLVSDANGCVAVDSMTVIVNPAVTASVGTDTAICNGNSALLGGNPTGSGGTAPYTYLWSPSGGLSSITSANPTAAPNLTTSYCVTVTDAVGCTASTCQRIDINPAVVANAGADQTMTACAGSFVQLGGTPTGTGGTGNYSYTWAPDSVGGVRVLNGTTIPRPFVTGLTTTTTFTVTVRDNITGCFATDQVVVNVNQSTLAVDAGFSKVFCGNSSSCVQIGGAPTASGGVGPYIYQWSPGLGLNSTTVANPCANPLITTNYSVTVTDALGCFLVDTMQVFVSPVITTDAGRDTIVCFNTSTVLGGTTVGGTGNYTFLWSPSQFLNSTTIARPTATNVTSNVTYTVTVTDSLGCSTTDIVTVGTRALPVASAGPDATIFACTADSVILGGSPTASGTVGPYTYAWTPAIPVPVNGANPVVKNLGFSTNFTVLVTDSFGCQASDQVYVTVQPNTVFVDAGTNIGTLCSNVGSCVTIGGAVLGGTAPYTYSWTGGTITGNTTLNPQVCPLTSTTYTIVVTDSRGCQASDTVLVTVNQAPNTSISGLSSAYCTSAGNVTMTGIPAGGTFSGPGVTGNIFQPSVVGQGFYCIKYVYTDPSTNCTDDTTICVTVNPDPVITISGYETAYCRFDAADTLVGSPAGGTFSGPGITGNVFNPATANIGNNIITYSYSDSLGCSGLTQVTLVVRPVPTITVSASRDTACVGQTVVLTPNYSTDVTNIQWSTVGGGIFASGLNPVTVTPTGVDYCVVATAVNNINGCATRDTVCLHVNQRPVAVNDELATCEEVMEVINVTVNDTDPEGDANTVTVLSVNHGTTSVNGPFITYQSNLNYNGLDTIVYAICNTQCSNACDTGIVAISVCPVNDPPVVIDIIDTIYQNQTDTTCPIATDVDNTNLTMSVLLCDTLNGSVTQIVNGCFTYTPTYNWIGTQTICIVACDSLGACDTGTVTIHVIPGNRAPRALDVNVAVCKNTPIGVNVAAAAGDPNGNPVTFSYGTVTGPTSANGSFTVTGNGAIVFTADSAGVYTFPYYVCDQSNLPPYSMCDTAIVTVVVYTCDSTNLPPVATDDIATVLTNTPIVVNELANDFDPNGDPLTVTLLSGPNLAGATTTLNANGTVTYTSPTTGVDSILYTICDPAGLCDSAYIIIYVDSLYMNHPPVAVDDYISTTYGTTVVVPVLNNDHDPDGNPITITAIPCAPADGTATITSTTVTYVPGPGLNALNPDTFCYVICDNAVPALCDTATVVITVPNSVQAVNDTVVTTPYIPVVIDVMDNDFDPEADSFYVTSVITGNTVGTVVLNPNGTVTYLPKDTCGFTDSFQYTVQDALGAVDTATVYVTVNCCTPPVAVNDAATILPNAPFSVNVLANDTLNNTSGSGQVVVSPAHGTAVFVNDSVLTYTPAANYCGPDTVVYRVRTNCGMDTALLVLNVYCNTPPIANADTVIVCTNGTVIIDVLANDNDAEGDTLTVTSVSTVPGIGIPTLNANGTITFEAGSIVGPFTLFYTVCDSSFPNLCSTGSIRIIIDACTPIDLPTTISATTCMDSAVTVCVGRYVSGASNFTITSTTGVDNGAVTLEAGDTCFTYTPVSGFVGNDTFTLTVCNGAGSCDSSQVVISVVDCLIDAIADACDVNTTIINTSVNVNVLDNDLIPVGSDTTITIISSVNNGMASVNFDNTIMVMPNTDYVGNITFTYEVCVTTGATSYCDTASVCVNVIDTNCVIPTGFSPNGDGTNDEFEIPCNDQFPNSTLRVYNRWGVEVWASDGHYNNDFKGQNMQGTNLPDGTYFIIYDYKDGVTKPVQRYLVIHR